MRCLATAVLALLAAGSSCGPGEATPATHGAAATPARAPEATLAPASEAPAVPADDRPVLDEAIETARTDAQRQVLPPGAELEPELQPRLSDPLPGASLSPEPLPGFFTPLAEPDEPRPLHAFEQALAELDAGTRTEPLRVAIYGASGTAVDLWTAYVRRYLQARFGDAGPGIVSAAPHNRWYRHHEYSVTASRHWTKHNAYRREGEDDPGWFGPMGVAMSARSRRAWAEVGPSRRWPEGRDVAFVEVWDLVQPGGGRYTVRLDGEVAEEVSTRLPRGEKTPRIGIHRFEVGGPMPTVRIEVRGGGEVRMLGVLAETGGPGVVLDTMGIDGAKITNFLTWDEALWADGLQRRDPALFVLAFGTNASVDEDQPIGAYEAAYREVLTRFRRTVPDASCVVFGPGDFPKVEGEQLLPRPRLDEIREVERRLAPEFGCAFWDALRFVGGEGAKGAWVEAGLARDDYLHLTRRGYVRLGMGFADALLQHFDATRLEEEAG